MVFPGQPLSSTNPVDIQERIKHKTQDVYNTQKTELLVVTRLGVKCKCI